jgi:D-alanyl-D-alanine carboxypeptidase/D-alanyl-D-alanine-endopeptidase (penicillin-binding protein 4)
VALALCVVHVAVQACATTPPAAPGARDPVDQLRQDIVGATHLPGVQRGVWSVAVHSLDRDERLVDLNSRALLVPASIAKVASVATAADAVGWDFRYETTIRATGPIVDGVLEGDLLVVGSGDPTIGGRAGDDLTGWVDALAAAGIRRIDGRIIGDDDAIDDPRPQLAWAWDDLGYTSGALFGALNFGENRLVVTIAPGPAAGTPATVGVEPHASYRPLASLVVTAPADAPQLLWPEQRPGEPFLTVAGTIPAGAPPARLSVAAGNPTFWFASVLRHRLLSAGIAVTGDAWDIDDVVPRPDRAAATVLLTYRSHSLAEIVQPLLKDSINLYAEAVMRLNAAPEAFPTNDAALEGFRRRLDAWGVPAKAQQIIDGSGLSRRNVISADAVLMLLQRMYEPAYASPFLTALPIAGVDGSLQNRMRDTPAAGNVRAKTGTMSNIRTMAGYAATRDGERLAFVVMVNNFEGPGAAATQAIDAIAVRLAAFSRGRR